MSIPMEKSLDNLWKILEKIRDESHRRKLEKAVKIISQNRNKIWLRTKTGKPYAEKTLKITEKLVNHLESNLLETIIDELEHQVTIIQDEGNRRSMVVT